MKVLRMQTKLKRIQTNRNRARCHRGVRSVLAIATLFACAAAFGLPGTALAQTSLHEITWAHGSPSNVVRFVVFVAATNGDQAGARQINVGKPANPQIQGNVSVYSAIISVDVSEYVAVGAIALNGSLSPLSAWSGLPPSPPGQPFYIP